MLPVSQAVQASKATQLRTAAGGDSTGEQGFASLFQQGLQAPASAEPSSAPPPTHAAAAADSAQSSAPAAGKTTTASAASGSGTQDASSKADGTPATVGTPPAQTRRSGDAKAGSDASAAPRARQGEAADTPDVSAAAAAAGALALQAQQRVSRQDAAGADDDSGAGADASASRKVRLDGAGRRPALTDLQPGDGVPHGTSAGKSALPAGADSSDGSDTGLAHADGGSGGAAAFGAGLTALLARQGSAGLSSLSAGAASGAQPAGTHAANGANSANGDPSQLYAQISQDALQNLTQATTLPPMQQVTLPVNAPFGDERWSAALGQQALFMARNQLSSAQLTVNPPNLGPIQITLDLKHDQASAVFVTPHDAVRQAIEASLPHLRDMFSAAGLNLGNAQVQADAGGSAWTAGGQGAGQGGSAAQGGNSQAGRGASAEAVSAPAPLRLSRGLLDTFA
ncbi:MAG: flagellar hook-length control protein FliK [Pseudomonadota bacterium]|nr:flagellar hook-length control protein FliK [Pseudomonadota bacterium]